MKDILNNPYVIKGLESLVLAVVVFVLARIAISIATRGGNRTTEAPFVINYSAIGFFAVSLVFIWLEGIGPILTALTIVAAALTIVAKELILNFIGSFVIFWRELFAIGDRVQIGEFSGDVIGKGILFFTLLELGSSGSTGHSTGRLIKIPNALALTMPVVNATRGAGYVWNEIAIAVTRESDWEEARRLMLACVEEYYENEAIDLNRVKLIFEKKRVFFNKLTPRTYVDVTTGGLSITLRYLCRSRLSRESQDAIVTNFIGKIRPADIELAEEQP